MWENDTRSEGEASYLSVTNIINKMSDKMDTERFIQMVKDCPILYNIQHQNYKDFPRKIREWNRIATDLNEPCEVLRTKWKGLKDGYTKYKKWKLYRSGIGKSYSNWRWAPYLEFLDPFVNQPKKTDNSQQTQSHDTSEYLNLDVSSNQSQEISKLEQDSLHTECMIKFEPIPSPYETSPTSESRSESQNSFQDPIQTTETDNNEKLLNFIQTTQAHRVDAVDLLFMSYADTFKKFSVGTQTQLKVKMATIFAEAELEEHNLNQGGML